MTDEIEDYIRRYTAFRDEQLYKLKKAVLLNFHHRPVWNIEKQGWDFKAPTWRKSDQMKRKPRGRPNNRKGTERSKVFPQFNKFESHAPTLPRRQSNKHTRGRPG